MKSYIAELVGTMLIVLGGCGAAIFAGQYYGPLGVAFAFGLSLMVGSYAFGHISGGHFNPAVTLALTLTHKFPKKQMSLYMASQFLGGLLGGIVLFILVQGTTISSVGFASNALLNGTTVLTGFLTEVIFTTILCLVAIETTAPRFPKGFAGLALGAALILIHLVTIPLTNTSVNPARSFGVAFFAGGPALSQLWIFIAAPLIGGWLAYVLYKFMQHPEA